MPENDQQRQGLSIHIKQAIFIALILVISIISVTSATLFFITSNQKQLNKSNMSATSNTIKRELGAHHKSLIDQGDAFAAMDNIQRAVRIRDIHELITVIANLRQHFQIDLFELLSPNLTVIARGHATGVYGDDKSENEFLKKLQQLPVKPTVSFIERDGMIPIQNKMLASPFTQLSLVSGYFLKVARPIIIEVAERKVIGYLILGKHLGQPLIDKFKQLTQSEIILFHNHKPVVQSNPHLSQINLNLSKPQSIFQITAPHLGRISYMTQNLAIHPGDQLQIAVLVSQTQLNKLFDSLYSNIIYLSAFIILLFIISGFWLSKSITNPIIALTKNAEIIASGNLEMAVQTTGHDEIGRLASSFNNMRLSIRRKIDELFLLDAATREMTKMHNRDNLLGFALKKALDLVSMQTGKIWLLHQENQLQREAIAQMGTTDDPENKNSTADFAAAQQAFEARKTIHQQNIYAIPLMIDNSVLGVLTLTMATTHTFDAYDAVKAVEALCGSLSIALQNTKLLELTAQTARMEQELETTRMVQSMFFPPARATFSEMSIYGKSVPATECGGDLWGYFPKTNEEFFVFVADATGHGTPAALITASAKSALLYIESLLQAKEKSYSPSKILFDLNQIICKTSRQQVMMTFFMGLFDQKNNRLTFSSAGHNPPLLIDMDTAKVRTVSSISAKGSILGYYDDATYQDDYIDLPPSFSLLAYSDGLIECTNLADQEYSARRLRRLLTRNAAQSLDPLMETIQQDNDAFRQGVPLADDSTYFLVQRSRLWVKPLQRTGINNL